MDKTNLFNIDFQTGSYNDCLDFTFNLINEKKSKFVCFANAHMVSLANKSPQFLNILSNSDAIFMDGMSIVFANRILNKNKTGHRFAGMDVIKDLLIKSEQDSISVYFYGSTETNLANLNVFINNNYPKLKVVGYLSPPFRELSIKEKELYSKIINKANPDIVFVSLGCPKQEIWMFEMKNQINTVMLGIGNAILTLSNQEKRAPLWLQKFGLEWLFRLILEPKRLFKRYFQTNFYFIYLFIIELKKRLPKK